MPDAKIKLHTSITYYTKYNQEMCPHPAPVVGDPLEENHLPILSYEGYNFLGWYYEDTYITKAKVDDPIPANLQLYAKWQPTVFTAMTLIANITRELSGFEGKLSLEDIIEKLNEVKLKFQIEFSINGTGYIADKNMTWHDWCNSNYNTSNFGNYYEDERVSDADDHIIYEDEFVHGSDIIIANYKYTVRFDPTVDV